MVNKNQKLIKTTLAVVMAVIIAISAQLNFKIGPVPYTMQNFGVILAGFILGPYYGMLSVAIYLGMVAMSLPFAAGGGGIGILMGYTSGYLFGFLITAFLAGYFRKKLEKSVIALWLSTFIASMPTYLLGFAVFYRFAVGNAKLSAFAENVIEMFGIPALSFPFMIFTATVLIYIPQDMLIDHLLAVGVYRHVRELMVQKGVEI